MCFPMPATMYIHQLPPKLTDMTALMLKDVNAQDVMVL